MTKMAFEINDLKGILILVLFAIPMIATTNINCNGRAFHCVNSTHFMICVDLGGGLSTTIDDFVIPCPATTVCQENNSFECDFPEVVTTPLLEVVGVYKQSDTSEPTTVTSSVTPTSEMFSVFNENLTATTLPIPEDVTPVVELEVLENIKDPVRVNSDNSTETSFKVTSSFIDTNNEIFNDKQTSNVTVITSSTDNNKTFAPAVETSIYKTVNTSLTDKSISNDTITSVIGLIHLISDDAPIVVNTTPYSEVLTSLDSSFDTIATTTEEYNTKKVTTLIETVDNPTDEINISTEAITTESSVISDVINTTPAVNQYNIHNSTENIHKSDINNISEQNTFIKSNKTIELVPETTTVHLTSAQTDNISEHVTVFDSPQPTTENTFTSLGTIDLISVDPKQSAPSTNDYINTHSIDTIPSNDQYTTNLDVTLSVKPVAVELINETPVIDTVVENYLKTDINNNSFTELNSTTAPETVPVLKINYSFPVLLAEKNLQTTTENTFVPRATVSSIINNTETVEISETLFNNESLIENQTIISQPLDVFIATDSPIVVTDNLYQINGELNQTLITTKSTTSDNINTTDKENTVFNATSKSIITEKNTVDALPLPSNMKDPVVEIMTTETLLNVISPRGLEVTIESPVVNESNNFNEPKYNVKNNTLHKKLNTVITTENNLTVLNTSSTVLNSSTTESTFTTPTPTNFPTIELSTAETLQNDFVTKAIEVENELNEGATNSSLRIDERKLENNGIIALLNVHTTPATYKVTTDLDTLAMDLSSQKDQHTDFTPEITTLKSSYVYTEVNQRTTQKTNAVSESPNQSKIPGIISLLKNQTDDKILDEDIGITTTQFLKDFTANTSLGDIVESINQDKVAASDVANSEHKVLKPILPQAPVTVDYVTELASTTPKTAQTVPISIDSTTIPRLVSSHNPVTDELYRTSTTGNIETSTKFPVDVTHTFNEENVPDVLVTALPLQQSSKQIISTVKQLNTTNSPTETISGLVFTTVKAAGYDVYNITDLNTSSWKNTAEIDTVSSKVQDTNADVKTETADPINGENNDNTTSSGVNTNKDNGIKIMSILDVVNSAENVMLSGTMQPSSPNPSLSTDYITTTASHDSGAYVTATENVYYNNLVHNESVSQKIPEATVSSIVTNISNSAVTTQTTLPVIETNNGNVEYVSTVANFPSNVHFKQDNPASTVHDYVTEKTNDYIPTDEMSSQSNKVPYVQAVTLRKSGNVIPDRVVTHGVSTVAPVYDEVSTIKDNAFVIQRTESPLLKLKVNQGSDTQTATYKKESSSPILEFLDAPVTIEPTHATVLTTPSAVIGLNNQEVLTGIKTTVLPEYGMSTVPIEPVTKINSETSYSTLSQTTPLGQINQDVFIGIKTTDLPQYGMSTVPIEPVTKINSETSYSTLSQTTPLGQINQDVFIGIKTTDFPQYVMKTVNNYIPQSVPSLPTAEITPSLITTAPSAIFVQTAIDQDVPLGFKSTELPQYEMSTVKNSNPQTIPSGLTIAKTTPIASSVKTNQYVTTEIKTTELPQYVISTIGNNNQQSIASLPTGRTASMASLPTGKTASQITTQSQHTINMLTENVPPEIKTINLPEPVTVVSNNSPELILSLVTRVSALQNTTEPTHTSNEYAKTTPLLAATAKAKEDIPSGSLPHFETTTVTYKNPPSISDITTETIIDSLYALDSMVETIKVVGDTITDTIPSSITFTSRPTAIRADNSVKNIIDHESIVIGTTSKTTKSVDYNRAEIVNHTESNWMPSDVNIDNLKIKQSSTEETDSQSSVSKSGTDIQNKATAVDSLIKSKIEPKDGIPNDKIEYRPTTATFTTNYNESESVSKNPSLSNTVAAKDKKTEIYYPANPNITIIDVKKHQAPADSKHISNSNNINNTKANITTSHYNLSQQNSTIHDELEQHLVSTNHTITAEIQSHLNESDKQSNKTREGLTVNSTMLNPHLISAKLNTSSKDTTVITVPASVFNCTNRTRGKYADTKDCRKFYTCIGTLQPILGICPNNTVFSEINKQCTRNLSHCVRNNQFRCLFEGRFSDFFKDNIYYICVKNRMHGFIRYKLQCQADYHLNKNSVKCEKNEEISTQSVSSVSETNNDESKPKPKSEKKVSTDDFECESEGKFPYAKDCIKYYECTKVKNVYRRKIKKCVSDEVFDKKKKKCVESDSGEC